MPKERSDSMRDHEVQLILRSPGVIDQRGVRPTQTRSPDLINVTEEPMMQRTSTVTGSIVRVELNRCCIPRGKTISEWYGWFQDLQINWEVDRSSPEAFCKWVEKQGPGCLRCSVQRSESRTLNEWKIDFQMRDSKDAHVIASWTTGWQR